GLERLLPHILPVNERAPAIGTQQSHEHVDGGGFSRAVGSEKSEELPLVDTQINAGHGDLVAEGLAQAGYLDGRGIRRQGRPLLISKAKTTRTEPSLRFLYRHRAGSGVAH